MGRLYRYATEVRGLLTHGPMPARKLRAALNVGRPWWNRWSVFGFYRLMMELEDARLIAYEEQDRGTLGGVRLHERVYRNTITIGE